MAFVEKQIRKDYLKCGIMMTVITVLITLFLIWGFGVYKETIIYILVIDIVPLLLSTYFLLVYSDPQKFGPLAKQIKKHPELREMLEYHYSNILYENDSFIISGRFISSTQKTFELINTDEVFWIYSEGATFNAVPAWLILLLIVTLFIGGWILVLILASQYHQITVEFARGKTCIAIKDTNDTMLNKINVLLSHCKNARYGKNKENKKYYNEMCRNWKSNSK